MFSDIYFNNNGNLNLCSINILIVHANAKHFIV